MPGAVKIDLNTKNLQKRLKRLGNHLGSYASFAAERLLSRMVAEMKQQIAENESIWQEDGSGLSLIVDGDDIEYEWNGNSGKIIVGAKTSRIKMQDGTTVNPYMFIEFGFGLIGQDFPTSHASQNGWRYNVNNHTKGWFYKGVDGGKHYSEGTQGISFFYGIISKYRKQWKKLVAESMGQQIKEDWRRK